MHSFYSRRFLNLRGHHAGAYALAIVEALPKDAIDEPFAREISFELADCSRRVMLDFPIHSATDRRNSVRKARLLADIARKFADAVEAEAELVAERTRRVP